MGIEIDEYGISACLLQSLLPLQNFSSFRDTSNDENKNLNILVIGRNLY